MLSDLPILLCYKIVYFTKPPEHSAPPFKPNIFKLVPEILLKAAVKWQQLTGAFFDESKILIDILHCWELLQWSWSLWINFTRTRHRCLHWCLTLYRDGIQQAPPCSCLYKQWEYACFPGWYSWYEWERRSLGRTVALFQNWHGAKESAGAKHLVVTSVSQRCSLGSCRNTSLMAAQRTQGRFAGFSAEHRNPRDGPDLLSWVLCKHNTEWLLLSQNYIYKKK